MTSQPSSAGVSGMSTSSIDWASLAQQWIQMRDNSTTGVELGSMFCSAMPPAPPPPNISGSYHIATAMPGHHKASLKKSSTYEEQGEADMEMDDDEEANFGRHNTFSVSPPSVPLVQLGDSVPALMKPQWLLQQQQLRVTNTSVPPTLDLGRRFIHPPPPLVTPVLVPSAPHINVAVAAAAAAAVAGLAVNPTAHIPSLMKINVPNPHEIKELPDVIAPASDEVGTSAAIAAGTCTMDAAKRKMLPAWIREGLEKMEREKQRQLEREQQHKPNASDDEEASSGIPPAAPEEHMVKAKILTNQLVAASESSGNEDEEVKAFSPAVDETNASTARGNKAVVDPEEGAPAPGDEEDAAASSLVMGKNYEQRMADLMIVVRRTLTELLLEVTNEEIANVAQDTVKWRKTQASSAQVIRKSAFSSITDKLGLAAYDDSSSGDASSSASEAEATDYDTQQDSEEELKSSIRTKRRAFAKIAEEIEERVADAAIREEQKLKHYAKLELEEEAARNKRDTAPDDRGTGRRHHHHHGHHGDGGVGGCIGGGGKGYDKEFGETTESKLQQSNGKRAKERLSRKERTTRFSDNKDSKSTSIAVAASYISQLAQSTAAKLLPTPKSTHAPSTAVSASVDLNSMYTTTATYAACAATVGGAGLSTALSGVETVPVKKGRAARAYGKQQSRSKRSRRHGDREESHSERRRRSRRRHSSDDDNDNEDGDSSSSSSSDTSSTSSSSTDSADGASSSPDSKYSRASSRAQSKRRHSYKRSSQRHSKTRSQHKRRCDNEHYRRRVAEDRDAKCSSHRAHHSCRRSDSRSRSRSTFSSRRRRR